MRHASRPTLLALLLAGCTLAPPVAEPITPRPTYRIAALGGGGRVIVRVDDAATGARVARADQGTEVEAIPQLGLKILQVPGDVPAALARLRAVAGVRYAEEDAVATAFDWVPNDPKLAQQWALATLQAPAAWGVASASAPIAILDTGIAQGHPDLSAAVTRQINFTTSNTSDDRYGHGTHVAGIAAALTGNGQGVAGVAVGAPLYNVKVLGDNGSGQYAWIARGIVWATDAGARVISMSLGGSVTSLALSDALRYAALRGVVLVAAAGNDGLSTPSYPAADDACLAVAATTQGDVRASFSNFGSWVDLAAPGVSILSTLPRKSRIGGSYYGTLSGTSMATPFVAGAASLLCSIPSSRSVRERLESSCDPVAGTGTAWRYGRLNLYRAITAP